MSRSRRKYEPQVIIIIIIIIIIHQHHLQVSLGSGESGSHVMQWNPVLGIFRWVTIIMMEAIVTEVVFRVNRYQTQFTLEKKVDKYKYELSKMDFIEEFLLRNMDHCAEYVISFLDFEVILLKEKCQK